MKGIELQNVTVGYGSSDVLCRLSLTVETGELVGVIGPNGSGKSTLLKTINGQLKPREGVVLIEGRDAKKLGRRRIAQIQAVVPQEMAVVFPFTAGQIVLMGRAPHLRPLQFEGPADFEAVERAMAVTETAPFADRLLAELSGGEKQRVVIARAIAQEAGQLLLDEPTAFLDLKHQVAIWGLVKRLRRERGITTVASSHDVNLAAQFCDRLILISEGEIFADGTPREVLVPAAIEAVYGTPVAVTVNERTGAPWVMPR